MSFDILRFEAARYVVDCDPAGGHGATVEPDADGVAPFTPDADGLNDHFGPVFSTLDIMDYEFLVFDRWSRVAFESTDPLDRWDGTMDGKLVSTGTYVWILRYRADRQSDRVEMRGHVTVVR